MAADRALLFGSVFRLGFGSSLPLHVARFVDTAMLQCLNVVDNIARARAGLSAGGRTGVGPLERSLGRCRSRDATAAVSSAA